MSLDHLSFSPSLREILYFIQPRDIINCQLVSRRFDDLITRNSLSMSRIQANMVIEYVYERGFQGLLSVRVETVEKKNVDRLSIDLTETHIMECGHRHCIRRHVRDYGYSPGLHRTRVIPNPGIKESLRLIFSHYFKKYHYRRIEFENINGADNEEMSEWCEIICDQYRKCRTKCQSLYLDLLHTNSSYLSGQLDPTCIITHAITNLHKVIDETPRWNKPIIIKVNPEAFNSFMPIVDLIKSWLCGKFDRMNGVSVYQKKAKEFPWTPREVVNMLNTEGVQCRRIIIRDGKTCVTLYDTTVEPFVLDSDRFYILRKADSRTLEVQCSLFRRILSI